MAKQTDSAESRVLEMGGLTLRPGDRIGAYIYERPVATGGMAHVVRARDPSGTVVALKVLKASRMGTGLVRFRREFRALARLSHPAIIGVEAYGDIHGHPYIVMEYVDGRDLHTVIRGFRQLTYADRWQQTRSILADLAAGLAHIHKHGLVHRDLKPSNVLIDHQGRAKLTDFGIVKDLDPANDPFVSTTLVGTWAYAAPEQISGHPIDHRSDLYSLGVILYAMLTSRRPFIATDMAGYLEAHRDKAPRPPRQVDSNVPTELADICMRLLAKAPRDRFQSAGEILALLDRSAPPPEITDEHEWEPPMVARDLELDQVRDAVGALTRQQGGLLLIGGPEGTGRTRLLHSALEYARVIGIPVRHTRMSAADGTFRALLRVAEDVSRELGTRTPGELATAVAAFSRDRGQLAGDLRYRLYDGIRQALGLLLQDGPQVLAIDDMHHAPRPLVDLLVYLQRSLIAQAQLPLLLALTSRTDVAAPALAPLLELEGIERVHLGALALGDIRELVEDLVGEGERASALAQRLHAETDGNPFFVAEFLRSMLKKGLLRSVGAGGMEIEAEATEITTRELEVPQSVRQVILERLRALPAPQQEIVQIVAVFGRAMDVDILLDLLDVDEDTALDHVDAVVATGLIEQQHSGTQELLDFAQRKVGEVIFRDLSAPVRRPLHRRLAAALERRHAHSPIAAEAIGEHYRQAGDEAEAWRHLVRAARGLRERSLLGEAWAICERLAPLEQAARSQLGDADFQQSLLDVLRVRADAWFNQGRWTDALELLSKLERAAGARGEAQIVAMARLDQGTCHWRLDHEDRGRALIQSVLEDARARHDRPVIIDALHRLASIAWEHGDLDTCERLASEGLVAASGPQLAANRAEILMARTAVQATRGELAAATAGLTEAEDIVRGLARKRVHAVILGNLSELMMWQGRLSEAVARSTQAIALARDVLYREGEAFGHRVRAMSLDAAGDMVGAAEDLQRSLALCEETGIASDMVATLYQYGVAALSLGEDDKAEALLRAGLQTAQRQDPERYAPALQAVLARAVRRSAPIEATELISAVTLELPSLPLPRRTQIQVQLGAAQLALGQVQAAVQVLSQAAAVASERGFRVWALRALVLLGRAHSGPQAARATLQAGALAREILAHLDGPLASHFRRRRDVAILLQA